MLPPRLGDVLDGKVTVCRPGDPIRSAAFKMADGDFSQLPVYQDGRVVDILTSEAIAFWMALSLAAGLPVDGETPVSEVVTADEDRSLQVVDMATMVVEAPEMFERAQ